jgi:hypothetical protein
MTVLCIENRYLIDGAIFRIMTFGNCENHLKQVFGALKRQFDRTRRKKKPVRRSFEPACYFTGRWQVNLLAAVVTV